MSETPLPFMVVSVVVRAIFFVVDLLVIGRRPHVPSTGECVRHIGFVVVMALIFGALIWQVAD